MRLDGCSLQQNPRTHWHSVVKPGHLPVRNWIQACIMWLSGALTIIEKIGVFILTDCQWVIEPFLKQCLFRNKLVVHKGTICSVCSSHFRDDDYLRKEESIWWKWAICFEEDLQDWSRLLSPHCLTLLDTVRVLLTHPAGLRQQCRTDQRGTLHSWPREPSKTCRYDAVNQ